MPDNMPKPSMLPAPNRFQYAPSFIGMYQCFFAYICQSEKSHRWRLCVAVYYNRKPKWLL